MKGAGPKPWDQRIFIESCYYLAEMDPTPRRGHILGQCGACLQNADMTSLSYDTRIYDTWRSFRKEMNEWAPVR